ncbi:MAG TPA: DUF455 family protein [Candidatus Sulfotelmatobacter sp.]|nr:DUF455 family protein [Candidatus Sulfotelmatobacter sp.]
MSGDLNVPLRENSPGNQQLRGRWMRHDTAHLLKRFFFCERALLLSQAAWLPKIASLPVKLGLAQAIWEDALVADALRERVFELRYPSRLLEEEGADAVLIALFQNLLESPSVSAFLLAIASVLAPALRDAYRQYLDLSDPIADAPTRRFLSSALADKVRQCQSAEGWCLEARSAEEGTASAHSWANAMADHLQAIGGISVVEPQCSTSIERLPGSTPYSTPDKPARDPRFWPCRFYWPDNVDSTFPYGEGTALQMRAAVSHLNEVWAVETGGVILSSFAKSLPWEWVRDAARWTYDESRHCHMGYDRLLQWGFRPAEIPLGTYIYESTAGQDPIYRLGMLFFFETKNIQKKQQRSRLFHSYGDSLSEHDMDFDWADETMHAGFGKHWLKEILALGNYPGVTPDQVHTRCSKFVNAIVATATSAEIRPLRERSGELLRLAARGLPLEKRQASPENE